MNLILVRLVKRLAIKSDVILENFKPGSKHHRYLLSEHHFLNVKKID
jgi:hypothetical protein